MGELKPIDSYSSWQLAQARIEQGVKSGQLSREKAREIQEKARKAYKNQDYNRAIEKHQGDK